MNASNTTDAPRPVELNRPLRDVAVGSAIAGITAITLLIAAAWPAPDDLEPPASANPPPQVEPDLGPESQPAPGDGKLEIIESGYTPIKDLAGDSMVSWGAIVENTSATMTAVSTVYIEPYDTDGESLGADTDWDLAVEVEHLMPGEVIGVGSTSYIDDGDFDGLKMHIGETIWFNPEDLDEGSLTTSDIATEWVDVGSTSNYWSDDGISFPENERGDLQVTFTVTSTFSTLLQDVSACVIYRDKDGDIIGASRPDDIGYSVDYPPGWSIRTLETSYGPPEGLDEGSIEVYALP